MYAAYFGFRRLPFNGVPAPEDLYTSGAFRDVLDAMCRGVDEGLDLIVFTGMPGSGKTTLLSRLHASLASKGVSVLVPDASQDLEKLIGGTRASVSRPSNTSAGASADRPPPEQATVEAVPRDNVVVIIDDAHCLPDRTLRGLLQSILRIQGTGPRATVVLAGTPSLERRLEEFTAQGGVEIAKRVCPLPPLSYEDVSAYIQRKLDSAGYHGPELFDEEAVRSVAQHSRGLPKRIDTICGMALLIAYDVGKMKVDGETMAEAVDDLEGGIESVPSRPRIAATSLESTDPAVTGERPYRPVTKAIRRLAHRLVVAARSRLPAIVALARGTVGAIRRAWHYALKGAQAAYRGAMGQRLAGRRARHGGKRKPSTPLPLGRERDWLALKVGFVGTLSLSLLVGLLVVLFTGSDQRTSEPASAQARAEQESGTPGEPSTAALGSKKQLDSLREENRTMQASLTEAREMLVSKDELIAKQQSSIEQLRRSVTATEVKQVNRDDPWVPVTMVLPAGFVLQVSTPGGGTFQVGPRGLAEHALEGLTFTGRLRPKDVELIKKLSTSPGITPSDDALPMYSEVGASDGAGEPTEPDRFLTASIQAVSSQSPEAGPAKGTVATLVESAEPPVEADSIDAPAVPSADSPAEPAPLESPMSPAQVEAVESAASRPEVEPADSAASPATLAPVDLAASPADDDPAEPVVSPTREAERLASARVPDLAPHAPRRPPAAPKIDTALPTAASPDEEGPAAALPAVRMPVAVTTESEGTARNPKTGERAPSTPAPAAPEIGRTAVATQPVMDAPISETESSSGPADHTESTVYTVVAGDTLFGIAHRFDVAVEQLRAWNGLTRDLLRPGQSIRLMNRPGAQSGETADELLAAAAAGDVATAARLLGSGAPVDARDSEGKTPLMHAAAGGHIVVVRLLIDRGADVALRSKTGDTALSYAAWHDNLFVVSTLLRRGAKVDAKNNEGWTPLLFAAINGHVRSVKRLLDAGADVNARDEESRTALSAAVWNGHVDVARALLEGGADVNARTSSGWTALMDAAWIGQAELVDMLLKNGANPTMADDAGLTPAAAARQQGHGEIAAMIVKFSEQPS